MAIQVRERAVFALLAHCADTLTQVDAALRVDPDPALAHLVRGFAFWLLAHSHVSLNVRSGSLRDPC